MIILNTSFHLHTSIQEEALRLIRNAYKRSAVDNGASSDAMLVRILGHDQPMSASYSLHLHFPDLNAAESWFASHGQALLEQMHKLWGEKALSFHTLLQVIS